MRILLIEDHPLTLEVYSQLIDNLVILPSDKSVIKASDCQQAYDIITNSLIEGNLFDLIIIDHNLPPYIEKNILSGSDLISFFKGKLHCKLFMITSHTESLIIYDILKNINPDGFAAKNDITGEAFSEAISVILNNEQFRSTTIENCISNVWKRGVIAELYNRQIILLLARGYRIKDLQEKIPITTSAIHKRISRMKKTFAAKDEKDLIRIIYHLGYM